MVFFGVPKNFRRREARVYTSKVRLAFARTDVEDPAVLQVAEGRGKALALVEGVLVDAEVARTIQGETFGCRWSLHRQAPRHG